MKKTTKAFFTYIILMTHTLYGNTVIVDRVIDGDTIKLQNGQVVRLIGLDAPETKHPAKPVMYYGKEAHDFLAARLSGQTVNLQYDKRKTDRYGRTLAYVYLQNGAFVNAELIKEGYAIVYHKQPFKYRDVFRQYQQNAIEQQKGMWKALLYSPAISNKIMQFVRD